MSIKYSGDNITFADNSVQNTAATGFGFKNRIINGSMAVDQRNNGASQSITVAGGNTYTVDRWFAITSGATITGQRVAGSGSNQYNYQFTGAASVTGIQFVQRIEQKNCYDLAGQTATLSCNFANSLLTTVSWAVYYAGTADSWGGSNTTIASGTFTVSSTLTNFSTQISIPAAATTGLQVVFSVGAQTSGTWTIGSVQLEKGSTATSFDYRPYGTELALCQRYYYRVVTDINSPFGVGFITSATLAYINVPFPTTMRITPTAVEQNGTAANYRVRWSAGATVCSSVVSFVNGSPSNAFVIFTVASGLTAGQGAFGESNLAGAYLGWSVEL